MSISTDYFSYIMGEIIDEVKKGELVMSCRHKITEVMNFKNPNNSGTGHVVYLAGAKKSMDINLPDCGLISVLSDDKVYQNLQIQPGKLDVDFRLIASFTNGAPAILFSPFHRTMYILFNLEELICRIAGLDDERIKKDIHGRYIAGFHQNQSRWETPVIEVIGNQIRNVFELNACADNYGLIMSHDVDRISYEFVMMIRTFLRDKKLELPSINPENDKIYCFIRNLAKTDKQHNIKSLWFFLSGRYSISRYGNRYSIQSGRAKYLLDIVKNNNHDVGMHLSYKGASNADRCQREKRLLETVSGREIHINRNHYLKYDVEKSPGLLVRSHFIADSTIGYSDKNGFRAGLCRPFFLWDHNADSISSVLELPLLFMDSVHGNDLQQSWDDILRVLSWIKRVKGGGMLLFHPCLMAESEEKQDFYENVIQESIRQSIPFRSVGEIVDNRGYAN